MKDHSQAAVWARRTRNISRDRDEEWGVNLFAGTIQVRAFYLTREQARAADISNYPDCPGYQGNGPVS